MWIQWAIGNVKELAEEAEHYILSETLKRLPSKVKTSELHETMIRVCLDKEDINYSRVAAVLEKATIFKNLERSGLLYPQGASFEDIADFMYMKGKWIDLLKDATDEDIQRINEVYYELESLDLEYWVIKQWREKYSYTLGKDLEIETNAMGALAIAIGLHGYTDLAYDLARDMCTYKTNLPTPVQNGIRNGNTDSISCCVIEGGDTIDSLDMASYLASSMTAKKAGIGIFLDTRGPTDPVKGGQVKHLGKAPLFMAIEKEVKKFTQITRGGSATISFRANDPEVMSMLLWKTQRIDIAQRIDKIDYEFLYNDAFVDAVLQNRDWYLFSPYWAPEVCENFHSPDYMEYVKRALANNVPHKKVKAIDVLLSFIDNRWETGRIYCHNVTTSNRHTPFLDTIKQSNLCMEIMLPTKPFTGIFDLVSESPEGEMAFCALAAINVANVDISEYFAVAERALRTVDRMIELAKGLTPGIEKQLKERRSVGIGITGLAAFLYRQGLDYDGSYESLVATEQLAATHYYALLQASQKMAVEDNFRVQGIDESWLPIDTMRPVTDVKDWDLEFDWEALRNKPRKHSVLVAHMPCESSSLLSNSTNGLYPTRRKVIYKKARTGRVQFIVPEYPEKLNTYRDIDMIPYYAAVQNYTDQAISADYYTDFAMYPNKKMPETEAIAWFIRQAKAGVKTSYYQNFRDTEYTKQEDEGDSCCKL